ncbi:hypothetical protein uan_070 [Pseudomonas phage UAntarctica]|nr:hypothetical protein uan_070 [Pseudomonas phage UAntarctica]
MAQIAIYNDANTILIDDEYINNTLVSKYSLEFNGFFTGMGNLYDFSITYGPEYTSFPPLIALYKDDGYIGISQIYYVTNPDGGFTRTYRIVGDITNSKRFEMFVFGIPQQSLGAGTGLLVLRNAQGAITFDSGLKYVRVVDFIDYRGMNRYGDGLLVKSYRAGRKYAYVFSQYQLWYDTSGSPGGIGDTMTVGVVSVAGGIQIGAYWMKWSTAHRKDAPYTQNNGLKLLVIDVTGL